MTFDGLENLSLGKTACQSSTYKRFSLDDASKALVDDGQRDFAFHTNLEDHPWWQVDLEDAYPVYYIVVGNRRIEAQERAITLTIETSLDGFTWQLIHTGFVSWDDDLIWPLGGRVAVRFVRLSLTEKTHLHLSKVEVWGLAEPGSTLEPEFEDNESLWAETKPEGLKELRGALMASAGPDELMTIDLEGNFHSIWALELHKPKVDSDSFQSLKIESSVDGREWQVIHEGLLVWPERLYFPLQGEIIARFIKLSLPGGSQAEPPQVTIFTRMYRDLEVRAQRRDGLGGRMGAMLNGLYIAKLLNCNFKIHWIERSLHSNDSGTQQIHMDKVENMFTEAFLQKHFLERLSAGTLPYFSKLDKARALSHRHLTNPSWHDLPGTIISTHKWPADLFHARLMPPKLYYKLLFEMLPFSPEYAKIADMARQADVSVDYAALHIRSGDLLYVTALREAILACKKIAPLQLSKMAIGKLKQEKRGMVLFGEDADLLAYLARTYTCSTASDYLPGDEFDSSQRDFFEIVLMSRASRIYAAPDSYFSMIASLIGGNIERFDLYEVASDLEKATYIEADLKENAHLYHPFHNSYSYFYLYHLTHQTASRELRLSFLEQAIQYDPGNAVLKLLRAVEYFKEGQGQSEEDGLQDLFNIDDTNMPFTYKSPFKKFSKFASELLNFELRMFDRFNYFKSLKEASRRGNLHAIEVMCIIYEIAGIHKVDSLLMSVANALRQKSRELDKTKMQLAKIKNTYESERCRRLRIQNSLSWKMTAPVRAIGRVIGLFKN